MTRLCSLTPLSHTLFLFTVDVMGKHIPMNAKLIPRVSMYLVMANVRNPQAVGAQSQQKRMSLVYLKIHAINNVSRWVLTFSTLVITPQKAAL